MMMRVFDIGFCNNPIEIGEKSQKVICLLHNSPPLDKLVSYKYTTLIVKALQLSLIT